MNKRQEAKETKKALAQLRKDLRKLALPMVLANIVAHHDVEDLCLLSQLCALLSLPSDASISRKLDLEATKTLMSQLEGCDNETIAAKIASRVIDYFQSFFCVAS